MSKRNPKPLKPTLGVLFSFVNADPSIIIVLKQSYTKETAMLDIDREEGGKIVFNFRNALILFTLIFIMSGAIHLSGSELSSSKADKNFNAPVNTAAP